MITIKGKVVKGLGQARRTVSNQLPHFVKHFPEVADCFAGTINILLEEHLVVQHADYTTPPIQWWEGGSEVFDFLRVQLTYKDLPEINSSHPVNYGISAVPRTVDAWIYIPRLSPNFGKPYLIEVLTKKINVKYGDDVQITIDKPAKITERIIEPSKTMKAIIV